jgi:hypothetical protein
MNLITFVRYYRGAFAVDRTGRTCLRSGHLDESLGCWTASMMMDGLDDDGQQEEFII